ncbi:hypothetical protein QTO34_009773 [Cnephaeus nilssonii]|uniref:40S ribosomal protein S12 n=1 Tax=Cnephaeus nilssonii TaxID=3371016 RepID=A0AA40HE40_CNENI|nr:hypothetical protein QTO34_009773 [Eptesicus nilssonii]
MDVNTALPEVLRTALIHTGLAGGIREAAKTLDKRQAHLCVLASNCDEPMYVKLVEALCAEHQIHLIKVDDKKLGEWGEMTAVQTSKPYQGQRLPIEPGGKQCPQYTVRTGHPPGEGGRGERQRPVRVTGERDGLTLRGYKGKVLQHHIQVQASLSLRKEAPLLPGEVQRDIAKGYAVLSG